MNNYTDMLYKYIESIEGNESLLKPFSALMDKQKRFKPITLLDGLSVYKQANTANYSYRINNPKWNLNTRSSCKTANLDEAKIIALKAYSRYEVMDEFNLIKRKGESFIEFTRRVVFPPWELNMEQQVKERDACTVPQLRKPMQQKINAINKRINHLENKCTYLHDIAIVDLRLKHIELFALDVLDNEQLSLDTFSNYLTAIRVVLDNAVSEDIIDAKPDTSLTKKVRDRFNKKNKREYLEGKEVSTIFKELDAAITMNEESLTNAKTSKYSEGKLSKLKSYKYYLQFILHTGTRSGDECFLIRWSDFRIKLAGEKFVKDYYCKITGGKTESQRGGREIIISKGNESSTIFEDSLSPLAKMQGFTGAKEAIDSLSDDFIFPVGVRDVQRYINSKWKVFSIEFTPYQFRHTYITNRILDVKEPIDLIAKNCGNSVEQIQKTYNHATAERYRDIELSS